MKQSTIFVISLILCAALSAACGFSKDGIQTTVIVVGFVNVLHAMERKPKE